MVELRCGRCSAPLEHGTGGRALVASGAWGQECDFQVLLCPTHAAEVRLLLKHYEAHRISVLAGNRLCLRLTDEAIPAPDILPARRAVVDEHRMPGWGASLLVAERAGFAPGFSGEAPRYLVARTALEQTWTCANKECRKEQERVAPRTYARVRGHNPQDRLFAICAGCSKKLGPDPEVEIE